MLQSKENESKDLDTVIPYHKNEILTFATLSVLLESRTVVKRTQKQVENCSSLIPQAFGQLKANSLLDKLYIKGIKHT